jgi:hypothetical protein
LVNIGEEILYPQIQGVTLGNIYAMRCTGLLSMTNFQATPIFVKNNHERPFSIIPKVNTYGFLTKKLSPSEIQEC